MNAHAPRESDDEWAARVTRAVRSGSREALAEIYDRCAEDVVASIERITRRDESFALDCLQEMFMRLASSPPVVDAHAALVAWMRLTALNVARNAIVADQRRTRREESAAAIRGCKEASADARRVTACVVENSVDRTVDRTVDRIMEQLDADQQTLLRLRHVEGMPIKAIARAIGATPRAVESAVRRIVAAIRAGGAS